MKKIEVVYDIELYPNLFLVVAMNIETGEIYVFEISPRKDDRHRLISFLKSLDMSTGFNNIFYDYPVLHYFINLYRATPNMRGRDLVAKLYKESGKIIHSDNRFGVKNPLVSQRDLFLINHFDNPSKSTSLKVLEFNMGMLNIRTLPYEVGKILMNNEIDDVIEYCKNDVLATYKFFIKNIDRIKFRERMSMKYNYDFTNYNDVKIGGKILVKALSEKLGINMYEIMKWRTYRKEMKVSDIILDKIKFNSVEFNTLLEWWKKKVITETKGQFTRLELDEVKELLPYCNNETEKGKLKNLNIIYKGFQFDFGTGGIHGSYHPGIWKEDKDTDIVLVDVSSYYPNLAYTNNFHPEHIPVNIFTAVIKMLYDQRMQAKKDGDTEVVKSIKLSLNGYLYGNSNSKFSYMYDPKFMMLICLNGQLLLSMLAEQMLDNGIEVIQVNTDGIAVKCPKEKRAILDELINNWMKFTGLKLDKDYFKLFVQRDVNNYLSVKRDGSVKLKGAFDFEYAKNGEWHKNFSMLIVAKTLYEYYVHGKDVREYIKEQRFKNPHLFFKRTKFNKGTRLVQREGINDKVLQNVTRYYVGKEGYEFVKIMPPLKDKVEEREFAVESGYKCVEMNRIRLSTLKEMCKNIDVDYYVNEVYKNINAVEDYIPEEMRSYILVDDL